MSLLKADKIKEEPPDVTTPEVENVEAVLACTCKSPPPSSPVNASSREFSDSGASQNEAGKDETTRQVLVSFGLNRKVVFRLSSLDKISLASKFDTYIRKENAYVQLMKSCHVVFQTYYSKFDAWADLENEEELTDGVVVKALFFPRRIRADEENPGYVRGDESPERSSKKRPRDYSPKDHAKGKHKVVKKAKHDNGENNEVASEEWRSDLEEGEIHNKKGQFKEAMRYCPPSSYRGRPSPSFRSRGSPGTFHQKSPAIFRQKQPGQFFRQMAVPWASTSKMFETPRRGEQTNNEKVQNMNQQSRKMKELNVRVQGGIALQPAGRMLYANGGGQLGHQAGNEMHEECISETGPMQNQKKKKKFICYKPRHWE